MANFRNTNPKEAEILAENIYSQSVFVYGIYSGLISAKTLFNAKSFNKVSKVFEKGYVKFKKVNIRSKYTATSFEGMERVVDKKLLITDITNTIGAGQSIYDKNKVIEVQENF